MGVYVERPSFMKVLLEKAKRPRLIGASAAASASWHDAASGRLRCMLVAGGPAGLDLIVDFG